MPSDSLIFLAEVTCAIDAVGTLKTLYYASGSYTTGPTESPANTYYEPRLLQPADFTRPMFSDVTTAGTSTVTFGTMDLSNVDGGLDAFKGYGFDLRLVRILVGDPTQPYNTFTLAQRGTMQLAQFSYKTLSFTFRDRQAELALPLCTVLYGGTNVLPAGLDGTSDIAGKPIPRLYGTALNFSPILCNTSLLIYQVHNGAINDVTNVYDAGVALTRGADYTTLADLQATAPASGTYRVYKAGGYFRLGSSPTQITCDANTGASVAARTPAQLLKQIALDMGIASSDISAADVAALDALAMVECGVWVSDQSNALDIMDMIAPCAGAYFGFDRTGTMRMAQLNAPSGTPGLIIDASQITDIDVVATNDANNGIPAYQVTVTYAKNYTSQTSGVAGSVSAARRLVIGQDNQSVVASDVTVKTQFLSSPIMQRDTVLISAADAQAEANRVLGLYKVLRMTYQVTVKLSPTLIGALDLGEVIQVTCNRFGMNNGTLLVIIQIEADYATKTAILTLWG